MSTEDLQLMFTAMLNDIQNEDYEKAKMVAYALYRLVQATAESHEQKIEEEQEEDDEPNGLEPPSAVAREGDQKQEP